HPARGAIVGHDDRGRRSPEAVCLHMADPSVEDARVVRARRRTERHGSAPGAAAGCPVPRHDVWERPRRVANVPWKPQVNRGGSDRQRPAGPFPGDRPRAAPDGPDRSEAVEGVRRVRRSCPARPLVHGRSASRHRNGGTAAGRDLFIRLGGWAHPGDRVEDRSGHRAPLVPACIQFRHQVRLRGEGERHCDLFLPGGVRRGRRRGHRASAWAMVGTLRLPEELPREREFRIPEFVRGPGSQGLTHADRKRGQSSRTAIAALWPAAPITPPPGCAPAPQRYKPRIGVRYEDHPGIGRNENIWDGKTAPWNTSPRVRPYSVSMVRGDLQWVATIAREIFGAYSARVSIIRSAKRLDSVSQEPLARSKGANFAETVRVCMPGGAVVGSFADSITNSRNGSRDGRPRFASSYARSR